MEKKEKRFQFHTNAKYNAQIVQLEGQPPCSAALVL